jgi:hypothetical protein
MVIYKVTGSPVLVRQTPSGDARVINVIGKNKLVYVAAEEAGWLRTSAGNYIFKTNDLSIDRDISNYREAIPKIRMMRFTSEPILDDDGNPIYEGNTIPDIEEVGIATVDTSSTSDGIPADSDTARQAETNSSDSINGSEILSTNKNAQVVAEDGTTHTAEEIGINDPNNMSILKDGPDENGNITFEKDGKTYTMKATDAKLGNAVSNGSASGITYNEFERRDIEEREKYSNSIIEELDMLKNRSTAAYRQAALNLQDGDIRHVFGMPSHLLPSTDPRPAQDVRKATSDLTMFGRKYREKIVSRAPIMIMQPGEAIFLRGYTNSAKEKIGEAIVGITGSDELEKIINGNGGEYYSFKLASSEYYYTVNSACRAVATFLGLDQVSVPSINAASKDNSSGEIFGSAYNGVMKVGSGDKLGSFNWAFNSGFNIASYYHGAVQFYINSEAQVQESLGTQTRQSGIAGQINGISDKAMEAMFIMGGLQSSLTDLTGIGSKTDTTSATSKLSGEDSKVGNGKGLFNSIVGNITSLLAGGRMYFPEIWADSQFGRSYNVTIKLDSPDCDPLSIYLNILVPLIHIMGFCLPRCAGDNTYISPFLVRAFYKSMFHIDMGIVTSCEIIKGDQGCWTQEGLPTQITVQLSIKDLYSVMTQSMGKSNNTILSNPAQLDYLANLCGVNVAPASLSRTLELWWMIKGANRIQDAIVSVPVDIVKNTFSMIQNFWNFNRNKM